MLLLKQLRQAGDIVELKVVELRHLAEARARLAGGALAHGLTVVLLLTVVVDALPLTLWRVHPVAGHDGLHVQGINGLLAVLGFLVLVENASVKGELAGILCELSHFVIHGTGLVLSLLQDVVDISLCDIFSLTAEDGLSAIADHGQKVVLVDRGLGLGHAALLDDEGVQAQLLVGLLDDLLLHAVANAEAKDLNLLLLANAMGAVHGLEIHLRVPVRVVEDNDVCCRKVDAEAASTG
mmetsp:Transcript_9432/g.26916  ORF Transcript_9432/g.26916 Transcript_9432/m.26916 type:complete len:238 (+) Transcript_9432:1126-1839(+)